MKNLILCSLMLTAGASISSAESQLERDFQLLNEQRAKAVAAAVEPINRKYEETLETLLKKAMQAADLDAAMKIKEELDALKSEKTQGQERSLQEALKGSRWLWPIEFAANTPEEIRWITFEDDQVVKHGWYGALSKWRQVKPTVIELTQDGDSKFEWIVEFNPTFTRATVTAEGRKKYAVKLISKAPEKP